jgi:hypothetical protein
MCRLFGVGAWTQEWRPLHPSRKCAHQLVYLYDPEGGVNRLADAARQLAMPDDAL